METNLNLSLGKCLTVKDSLQFLVLSREQIGKNFRASGKDKLKPLCGEFPGATNDQFDLIVRKQIYPYEYMNTWDGFLDTGLKPKDPFYNKLRGQAISVDEYAHAQKVFSTFGRKTILEYHQFYLKYMSSPLFATCTCDSIRSVSLLLPIQRDQLSMSLLFSHLLPSYTSPHHLNTSKLSTGQGEGVVLADPIEVLRNSCNKTKNSRLIPTRGR